VGLTEIHRLRSDLYDRDRKGIGRMGELVTAVSRQRQHDCTGQRADGCPELEQLNTDLLTAFKGPLMVGYRRFDEAVRVLDVPPTFDVERPDPAP
jgi:hypothetical protein